MGCFCRWEKAYSGRNIGWSLHLCGTKLWTRPLNLPFNILALVNGRERHGYQHTFAQNVENFPQDYCSPCFSTYCWCYSFQLCDVVLNTLVFLFCSTFLEQSVVVLTEEYLLVCYWLFGLMIAVTVPPICFVLDLIYNWQVNEDQYSSMP